MAVITKGVYFRFRHKIGEDTHMKLVIYLVGYGLKVIFGVRKNDECKRENK